MGILPTRSGFASEFHPACLKMEFKGGPSVEHGNGGPLQHSCLEPGGLQSMGSQSRTLLSPQ